MAKSILQKEKECYLCRMEAAEKGYYGELPSYGLHKHHFIHGTANRKKAEKYGLWAYVCVARHHIVGPEAPHADAEVGRKLHRIAQAKFEETHSREEFRKEFGKSWL